jgi:endonuclease/exonuclease/phosphatase (EEP) superfamily protein YafD
MNMFAFEVFLLLLPCALAGFAYRLRRLQVAAGVAVLLLVFVFGKFFYPKGQSALAASGSLKVMTYNMLVYTPNSPAILGVIREENADVVFIQETSFDVADLLETEMKDAYPYQIHYPSEIPLGTSVISKYPFTEIEAGIESRWVGKPILLEVDWNGTTVNAVNFHMLPTPLAAIVRPDVFNKISDVRTEEASVLIEFLRTHPGPAIVAGDMNDVFLNDPYLMLVNSGLQDAWAAAGFGLGHTFPGNKSPGTSRLHFGDYYIPEWLVRIDYVFATPEWAVVSAHIARTDGYSDHRPVVAELHLR